MQLFELIKEEDFLLDVSAKKKEDIIKEMLSVLAKNKGLEKIAKDLQKEVIARENVGTTAIGKGLAVPHVKTNLIKGIFGCLAFFRDGVDFKSLDDSKAHVVFLVVASPDLSVEYLKLMSQATRVLKDAQNQRIIFSASDKTGILGVLKKVCR